MRPRHTAKARRAPDKPISPGGYVTPIWIRLVVAIATVLVFAAVGLAQWGLLLAVVVLSVTEVYARRRRQ